MKIIEKRQEKFKRLAQQRTNKVLKALSVLGNCSNRNQYEYSPEDIKRIFSEIESTVKEVKGRFHYSKGRKRFKL